MKRVLVTPLDWGLGHATRCIPIIHQLLARNCSVFLAGSGDSLSLLKTEFPELPLFSLPSYAPVYPSSGSMALKIAAQVPKFLRVIRDEHVRLEQIITESKIDIVISDHRYGCWSSEVPCVFITHQYTIIPPSGYGWVSGLVNWMHRHLIRNFLVCWIPDLIGESNLAGTLSGDGRVRSNNVKYVGILSRFCNTNGQAKKYDVVCLLSGPEPQRGIFEELVTAALNRSPLRYCIVRGLPSHDKMDSENGFNFLRGKELLSVLDQADLVIARSGYSTVMDLARIGKRAIFVPTPGQPEQEYLAARLMRQRIAYAMPQGRFNLDAALEASKAYSGFSSLPEDNGLLSGALDELLNQRDTSNSNE